MKKMGKTRATLKSKDPVRIKRPGSLVKVLLDQALERAAGQLGCLPDR